MKILSFLLCLVTMSASTLFAQAGPPGMISIEVIIGNRPPAPNEEQLMRAEEAKHPNITNAMHDIEKSMRSLHNAPIIAGSSRNGSK